MPDLGLPLLDPRRGDAENDATNMRQKSLAQMAARILTEISLPKFLLSLGMTVILPALAIGLAPLIVSAWLGFFARTDHALAGLIALLVVFALIVALTSGWRGFLQIVEQNFWALNAVAVQPAYLMIREALRIAMERWTDTPTERLRAGTAILAGLILSFSGIILAQAAWPSSRWVVLFWDIVAFRQMAMPALANGLVIVGIYLAVAVLFWCLADAWTDQATAALPFSDLPSDVRPFRVAHLSDVHVVGERYGFRIECGRDGPQGNGRFTRAMMKLEELHAARPLDLVLFSGDMTDAGLSTEWAEFFDVLDRYPALKKITLMLPGNHDINIVDRANPARLDLPLSVGKRMRRLRCLSAMADVQGARARVTDESGRTSVALNEYVLPFRQDITQFADAGGLRLSMSLSQVWDNCFPMVVDPAHETGVGVVVLNSNAETHFSFTNALGLVSERQIGPILRTMARFPRAAWIIAQHHHLVEYPQRYAAFSERVGTAVTNSPWFLRRLRSVAHRCIVMHGHRHVDWVGMCGKLKIISAPSPVMEAHDDDGTGFYIHSVWMGGDGKVCAGVPEWVVLEGAQTRDRSF